MATARITGPLEAKGLGGTLNGVPTTCGRTTVTWHSFPIPQADRSQIAVGFSANGVEIYSRLKFGKFAVVGGFDDYIPFDLSPLINPDFKTRYAILGAEWHISPSGYAYFESRLGDTTDAQGNGRLQRSSPRLPLRLQLEDAASAVNQLASSTQKRISR